MTRRTHPAILPTRKIHALPAGSPMSKALAPVPGPWFSIPYFLFPVPRLTVI
jgi:hypothetical protein